MAAIQTARGGREGKRKREQQTDWMRRADLIGRRAIVANCPQRAQRDHREWHTAAQVLSLWSDSRGHWTGPIGLQSHYSTDEGDNMWVRCWQSHRGTRPKPAALPGRKTCSSTDRISINHLTNFDSYRFTKPHSKVVCFFHLFHEMESWPTISLGLSGCYMLRLVIGQKSQEAHVQLYLNQSAYVPFL